MALDGGFILASDGDQSAAITRITLP
jgi:hypothetical protein